MDIASTPAATQFVATAISSTDAIASTTPNISAAPGSIRPAATGRFAVRFISASISRSYHMLMAPEAPAPTAIHRIATGARTGGRLPGPTHRPRNAAEDADD